MRRCKNQSLLFTGLVLGMVFCGATLAQTNVLIDEDFQDPMYPRGTLAPTGFDGWWITAETERNDGASTVPGENYPAFTNQVLHFEFTSFEMVYTNTGHAWASNEAYTVRWNASSSGHVDPNPKYVEVSLAETNGTVLWSVSLLMPPYDNFGRTNWTEETTFEYVVWASQFTTGTEGEPPAAGKMVEFGTKEISTIIHFTHTE